MFEATYIFFEIIVIGLFLIAFYTREEIMWALTVIFSAVMMFTSYNIEIKHYAFNATTNAYYMNITSQSYPYLMAINFIFFGLALALGLSDMFSKYGKDMPGSDRLNIGNGKDV